MSRWHTHINANHGTWRGWVRSLLAEGEYGVGRLDPFLLPDLASVSRLVFVCLGNINRSAFAEQVAKGLGIRCCSVGLSTTAGAPATVMARQHAPRFGCSLDDHRATRLQDHRSCDGDLLLVMEVRHARALVALGHAPGTIAMLGHWASPRRLHLHDPHTLSGAYYESCFTLIRSAVEGLGRDLRRSGAAATS